MAQFSEDPQQFNPYKYFRFRIKWDGRYVAGVSKIIALGRTTDSVKYREGGAPGMVCKSPGPTEYNAVTLERGVTHDTEFGKWAGQVFSDDPGFRKDIIIEMYSVAGQRVTAYKLYRCWPSKYQALPELDAGGNQMAIETLTLENEGWERDYDVAEPTEPAG